MSDSKKYYYLKLKENFYDSEEMIILQNMQDGYLYSDILLKLYLRSLKNEGKLMFKDVIPYTPSVLAQVVRHQVGTVEKALEIFQKLGLIEVLDNGAIYMYDIQNFIGKSSTEADRIRDYRKNISSEIQKCTNVQLLNNKCTPEIEIEIEKEIDIEINNNKYNYEEFQKQYNEICTNLPKIQKLTTKRKTNIRKFLSEFTLEDFITICKKANESDFMQGKNERNWKADFDFLIKVDKATNILEGKYDNTKKQNENHINYNNLDNLYANFKN